MHLLFDFDGTLVDSFNCVMNKGLLLAEQHGFRKIQQHEIDALRDLSSVEVLKYLKIPIYKIPQLILQMRKYLHQEIPSLMPVPGIQQIIEQFYYAKLNMGILTSNAVNNVEEWLELNNMRQFFTFIHTESKYFSKGRLIKKVLKKYKIDKSKVVYIADETRDIEAAHKNNIRSLAVTWGYNSEQVLLKYKPSAVVRKPNELLDLIQC
ncbi:HAD hydrolase-like protein [Legionella norrlandica]|uniref:HAD hydrolase-like protein n=1 Tax=Legionella norrlandica TaxID=1498499 RepID=UPI0005626C43|nr:HAD hydrolase-like protein [Legionella norrlandica]